MFVTHIEGEVRPVASPTVYQIEDAIRRLDGQRATLISLETDGEARMWIGGGEENMYICSATFDGCQCYNCLIRRWWVLHPGYRALVPRDHSWCRWFVSQRHW